MSSKSILCWNSATFSGLASVTGRMGTAAHPDVLMIEMSNVPISWAILMISSLSSPISGRRTGNPRSFCSAFMFMRVCEATWPRESPMMMPEAPFSMAKRFATLCIVLLQRTH